MAVKKIFCRLFEGFDTSKVLAILVAAKGLHKLIKLEGDIVTIDVPVSSFKLWKPIVKNIFSSVLKGIDFNLVNGIVDTFVASREIVNPAFESFVLPADLPIGIKAIESIGGFGTVEKRKFAYDFTDPRIDSLRKENDSRLTYYIKPSYFKFLETNVSNSLIKGLALIGKPGTGKSTDAIAIVRHLGGIVISTQLSGGMLENNVFVNTKPNRVLSDYIAKIQRHEKLSALELEEYELLAQSSASFIEVEEAIMQALRLNCSILLDEFQYANILLKARFNVLTDDSIVFRHEGKDYPLPPNFFLFFTWNPGDDGTSDIPKALKSRFPVLIVPAIDVATHQKRVIAYCSKKISLSSVDPIFIDMLYTFGNLVEEKQTEMRHHGGSFTIRSTQRFLSNVLCSEHSKKDFLLELCAQFVNALWGTDVENTDKIQDKLAEPLFATRIEDLFKRYKSMFVSKSVPTYTFEELIEDVASSTPATSTAEPTSGVTASSGDGDWADEAASAFSK